SAELHIAPGDQPAVGKADCLSIFLYILGRGRRRLFAYSQVAAMPVRPPAIASNLVSVKPNNSSRVKDWLWLAIGVLRQGRLEFHLSALDFPPLFQKAALD